MFKDTSELAENKLLLLYILNKLPSPTSNTLVTQVVLENNLINYFSLQQYLSELIDNEFVKDSKHNNSHKLTLTESGKNALEFFINRIPEEKVVLIDNHLNSSEYSCEVFKSFIASYEVEEKSTKVMLVLKENDRISMSLTLNVDTKDEASLICENWRCKGSLLQEEIINLLK